MSPDPIETLSHEPLTPTRFLARSGTVFGDRLAVVDEGLRLTYAELLDRCERLAGALIDLGAGCGTPVAVLASNTHVLLECHLGVPLTGAPLVAMNVRVTARELAHIIEHSGAAIVIYERTFGDTVAEVQNQVRRKLRLVRASARDDEYEALVSNGRRARVPVTDERGLLSLNYTSGTTGKPKGVRYHHRGAYLQALAMAYHSRLYPESVFLWTLPMFHCNGWCFPWAVTAAGAVHVCLPKVDPAEIWRLIRHEGVTHFNAAPTVLTMLANHPGRSSSPAPRRIRVATGGAPPSPTLLEQMDGLGMDVTHLYGLTETFGPAVICDWRPEWDELDIREQARIKARQGVGNVVSESLRVIDEDGHDVVANGEQMGQVAVRGNNVMLGYEKDPEATRSAAPDGWFRTGDLGVMHPDGYVELRDRAKDVIISGGENIASVEVEQAIVAHPGVLECAVVGAPDDTWGEIPIAYVTLKPGTDTAEDDIIRFARARLAHFKAPKRVVFGELPKTSTGKIQKFLLREQARAANAQLTT